ncbi:MAG: TIGR00730 family Rossman fold protein [Bacillota bacterium]
MGSLLNICVYCSSSNKLDHAYCDLAWELGRSIGERGHTLVYGGTSIGLMGLVALGVHDAGGRVIGIIPRRIHDRGVTYQAADEVVLTADLRERKAVMDQHSDAFIALPGGFGTLEEILEAITHKQLQFHNKPVVLINFRGFYDSLLAQFERSYVEQFARPVYRELYAVVESAPAALGYIETYSPPELGNKYE